MLIGNVIKIVTSQCSHSSSLHLQSEPSLCLAAKVPSTAAAVTLKLPRPSRPWHLALRRAVFLKFIFTSTKKAAGLPKILIWFGWDCFVLFTYLYFPNFLSLCVCINNCFHFILRYPHEAGIMTPALQTRQLRRAKRFGSSPSVAQPAAEGLGNDPEQSDSRTSASHGC